MSSVIRAIAAATLLLAVAPGSRAAEPAGEGWSYEAMPFLWASGIDGRQGFDGHVSEVSADFGDLVEFVDGGAAMRLSASKAPFGWFAEVNYAKLGHQVSTSAGGLDIATAQMFAEAGISYDFGPRVAVYGGARYQRTDLDLGLGDMRLSRDKGWFDAFAGARWTLVATDRWAAWARADIGAGGSDFTWLGEIGGGYRFGKRWSAYAAYRVLDTDYANSGFVYDVRQSGLLLGLGIRF